MNFLSLFFFCTILSAAAECPHSLRISTFLPTHKREIVKTPCRTFCLVINFLVELCVLKMNESLSFNTKSASLVSQIERWILPKYRHSLYSRKKPLSHFFQREFSHGSHEREKEKKRRKTRQTPFCPAPIRCVNLFQLKIAALISHLVDIQLRPLISLFTTMTLQHFSVEHVVIFSAKFASKWETCRRRSRGVST